MVFNVSDKLTLTLDKTFFVQFDTNVETCITLNISYDNKIIDKVVVTWPATCQSGSSVLGSVAFFTKRSSFPLVFSCL
jgi:hypothetical protein